MSMRSQRQCTRVVTKEDLRNPYHRKSQTEKTIDRVKRGKCPLCHLKPTMCDTCQKIWD